MTPAQMEQLNYALTAFISMQQQQQQQDPQERAAAEEGGAPGAVDREGAKAGEEERKEAGGMQVGAPPPPPPSCPVLRLGAGRESAPACVRSFTFATIATEHVVSLADCHYPALRKGPPLSNPRRVHLTAHRTTHVHANAAISALSAELHPVPTLQQYNVAVIPKLCIGVTGVRSVFHTGGEARTWAPACTRWLAPVCTPACVHGARVRAWGTRVRVLVWHGSKCGNLVQVGMTCALRLAFTRPVTNNKPFCNIARDLCLPGAPR